MKILFICGSAEIGYDGVGDYTRRLCSMLIKLGHNAQMVSLCDYHILSLTTEKQIIENISIIVNRLPISITNKQRFIFLQNIIYDFIPDWISLQFVPYSFNPKGIPFWLPSFLKNLKGNHKLHIMFHELWLGLDIESSFKHKCIGELQKIIIKKLVNNTKIHLITTQIKIYKSFLESHSINAEILPICGNIPVTALKKNIISFTQFVLFGTIHNGVPFREFIEDLINLNTFHKPLKFVFIGKNGLELKGYIKILLQHNLSYEILGIQSEKVISQTLIDSEFGISTTPYYQTEKSGVYAAYREHQLNVICISRQWTPSSGDYSIPDIIKYEKNNLNIIPLNKYRYNLDNMTMEFIDKISNL